MSQKYRDRRQRLREQRRNDELAYDRLQQASQDSQRRLSRDVTMTEEDLVSACLQRSGEESQRILARDVDINEARLNGYCLQRAGG